MSAITKRKRNKNNRIQVHSSLKKKKKEIENS